MLPKVNHVAQAAPVELPSLLVLIKENIFYPNNNSNEFLLPAAKYYI
jgi:hypothetical protein